MILVTLAFTILLLMFLIGPVLYKRSEDVVNQSEENLRLYKERQKDLEESDIDEESKAALTLELDREFLATTKLESEADKQAAAPTRWLMTFAILIVVMGSSLIGYQYWGADDELKATELLNKYSQRQLTSTELEQLNQHVAAAAKGKNNPIEWADMHARLLMNQGKYAQAEEAFADLLFALPIEADSYRASIMLWLAEAKLAVLEQKAQTGQPVTEAERADIVESAYSLYDEALKLEPDQPQARAKAGMFAFEIQDFHGVIKHWGELWQKTTDLEYAGLLEEGIRRAADELTLMGEEVDLSFLKRTGLTVLVDVSDEAKQGLPGDTTVFIAATAVDGPPMPLAAQRIILADLPKEVLLSDAQAVVPGMNISNFEQVNIRATLSISGQPSAQTGDWQGEVTPVDNDHEGVINVVIDKQL